jgi:hypothetical protein
LVRISGVVLPWFGAATVFVLPREGQGVVAEGTLDSDRVFVASNTCRRKSLMP